MKHGPRITSRRSRTTGRRPWGAALRHPIWGLRFAICLLPLLSACSSASAPAVPTFVAPTPRATSSAAAFINRPTYDVTAATLTEEFAVRGELVAAQQADLAFGIAGMIKSVSVVPGQNVIAGERLAELDAPTQQQNLLQRQANLTIAQLQLQQLRGTGLATSIEIAIAEERIKLAESLYALAQQQHGATVLNAPFGGTVVALSKYQGYRVNAYESVGVLADLTQVNVRGYLPAQDRDRIAVGQQARVTVDGFGSTVFTGVVTEIAPEAVSWQGGLAYEFGVELAEGQTLPNIAQVGVGIALTGETHPDVPWVPNSAVITLGGETYLDVLRADGIQRVIVVTGIVQEQRTEIVAGVATGDTVVFP